MAGIFLSYSRADRPVAQMVAEALQAEGFEVWWDKVLRAGQTYDEVTESMLRNSAVVVVLWSTTSVKSKWVRAEATLGERNATVIPAMIEEADRPIMFELTQTADLIGWQGDTSSPHWKNFVADIRRVIDAQPVQAAPAAAVPAAPPAPDATIENTYWMSIKDTTDPVELDSYLKRYPDGHFSDLARSRLRGMAAAQAAAAPPPPASPPPAPTVTSRPEPVAAISRPASPKKAKSGAAIPVMVAGLIAIGAAGFGIWKFAGNDAPAVPAQPVAATPVEVDVAGAETTAETGQEPAVIEVAATESVIPDTPVAPEPEPAPACDFCPELIAIPAGRFLIGSPDGERGRVGNEGPQTEITLPAFEMSRTEITQAQWGACVSAAACRDVRQPPDGDLPVGSVSWDDAQTYIKWLSSQTGRNYRLPSEAEWEYAARAGTVTPFWWGENYDRSKIVSGSSAPAASLPANAFGLIGTLGNLREWTQDCYANSYTNIPRDGRPSQAGDCSLRVIRGGSYKHGAAEHRAANRARVSKRTRDPAVGFRVVVSD